MFVEGCYLHTAIVMTYSTDKLRKWVFLFIGWCEYLYLDRALVTLHSALGCVLYTGVSQFSTIQHFLSLLNQENVKNRFC